MPVHFYLTVQCHISCDSNIYILICIMYKELRTTSERSGRPEDGFVKAKICCLFEIQINKLCWTDPCLYTACITFISNTTGWITSKLLLVKLNLSTRTRTSRQNYYNAALIFTLTSNIIKSVWDPIYINTVLYYSSTINGRPEDGFVEAKTCRLFERQINKLCWTDPCLHTSCITYIRKG
jgi:hypothetical protein